MSAQEARRITTDVLLSVIATISGKAMLSDIEQGLRIVCGLLTIVSLCLLIAVNWEKGTAQIKKWRGKK